MTEQQHRVAHHEAGHAIVSVALGWAAPAATIRPGRAFGGLTLTQPPAVPDVIAPVASVVSRRDERWWVEENIMVTLAGDIAAEMFTAPTIGRQPTRVTEKVGEELDHRETALTEAERGRFAVASTRDHLTTDAERVAELIDFLHEDSFVAARLHLDWLEAETRRTLSQPWVAHAVRALAAELLTSGSVAGAAVGRIVDEARQSSIPRRTAEWHPGVLDAAANSSRRGVKRTASHRFSHPVDVDGWRGCPRASSAASNNPASALTRNDQQQTERGPQWR